MSALPEVVLAVVSGDQIVSLRRPRERRGSWYLDGAQVPPEDVMLTSQRLLMVVDPENTAQVERLRECFTDAGFPTDTIQANLRDRLRPPAQLEDA